MRGTGARATRRAARRSAARANLVRVKREHEHVLADARHGAGDAVVDEAALAAPLLPALEVDLVRRRCGGRRRQLWLLAQGASRGRRRRRHRTRARTHSSVRLAARGRAVEGAGGARAPRAAIAGCSDARARAAIAERATSPAGRTQAAAAARAQRPLEREGPQAADPNGAAGVVLRGPAVEEVARSAVMGRR